MSAQREQRLDSIQVQEKETLSLATGLRARAPAVPVNRLRFVEHGQEIGAAHEHQCSSVV
jgi:hypothetical protein